MRTGPYRTAPPEAPPPPDEPDVPPELPPDEPEAPLLPLLVRLPVPLVEDVPPPVVLRSPVLGPEVPEVAPDGEVALVPEPLALPLLTAFGLFVFVLVPWVTVPPLFC